jgi:uncharacterized membrane protein YeiH
MSAMIFLDYVGVTLFAATGALVASRKQLDIIGFIFLATATGAGGGTLRDLVLGVPVFWVEQPRYLMACIGAAVATFFTAHLLESRYRWVLWLDAVAISAYGVLGAHKGLAVTGSPVVAVLMGMTTAAVGGVIRDVLADEPSVLLRKEIYMVAAMTGAAVFVAADMAGLSLPLAAGMGFAAAFGLRSGALARGWTLPAYRSRPGRDPDESLGRDDLDDGS